MHPFKLFHSDIIRLTRYFAVCMSEGREPDGAKAEAANVTASSKFDSGPRDEDDDDEDAGVDGRAEMEVGVLSNVNAYSYRDQSKRTHTRHHIS